MDNTVTCICQMCYSNFSTAFILPNYTTKALCEECERIAKEYTDQGRTVPREVVDRRRSSYWSSQQPNTKDEPSLSPWQIIDGIHKTRRWLDIPNIDIGGETPLDALPIGKEEKPMPYGSKKPMKKEEKKKGKK